MFAGRRFVLIGAIGVAVWWVCVVAFWALQPLSDSVPVGIDYAFETPASVSVSVDCNGLVDSTPRNDSPLPALTAPPTGKPALKFQRDPCVLVHDHARLVFVLDTAVFLLTVAGFIWFVRRRRRSVSSRRLGAEANLLGVFPG